MASTLPATTGAPPPPPDRWWAEIGQLASQLAVLISAIATAYRAWKGL